MPVRKKTTRKKASTKKAVRKTPAIIVRGRGESEPMEQSMGANVGFNDSDSEQVIVQSSMTEVESASFKEKAANLAFMDEMVTVHIQDTSEKDAQIVFEVAVNGKSQVFERGKEFTVHRRFIEGLARAKPINYRCEEYTDQFGVRHFKYPAHKGLRFPFSVRNDPNQLGPDWLRCVLLEP